MTPSVEKAWSCPDCPWEHAAHPIFGWTHRDDRAVEVHQTMLCPSRTSPGGSTD